MASIKQVTPAGLAASRTGEAARSFFEMAGKIATTDLITIRKQIQPNPFLKLKKRAQTIPSPIDVELHINPVALGVTAVGLALTAWLFQLRVTRKQISYIESRRLEVDMPLVYNVDDYLPAEWTWYQASPKQTFYALAEAGNVILNVLTFGGIKHIIPSSEFIVKDTDRVISEKYLWHPAEGHWETVYGHFGEPHQNWVEDKASWGELIGYHMSVTIYHETFRMANDLESREGFKVSIT